MTLRGDNYPKLSGWAQYNHKSLYTLKKKKKKRQQKLESECNNVRKTGLTIAGLKNGAGTTAQESGKPKNMGSLWMMEKARK